MWVGPRLPAHCACALRRRYVLQPVPPVLAVQADLDADMDYAFGLFEPGEDGCVDENEV